MRLFFYLSLFLLSCHGVWSQSARYGQKYFVRWDEKKTGGRWFETAVGQKYSDGSYDVVAHDGDKGVYPGNKISKLGIRSSIGDTVISYWDNRNYAFKGSHTANHPDGRVYVKYDDGDEAWMSSWRVHKLITI